MKKVETKPKWWIVFNPYKPEMPPKFRYPTLFAAQKDAAKIAQREGVKVHVLGLVGSFEPVMIPVPWVTAVEAVEIMEGIPNEIPLSH